MVAPAIGLAAKVLMWLNVGERMANLWDRIRGKRKPQSTTQVDEIPKENYRPRPTTPAAMVFGLIVAAGMTHGCASLGSQDIQDLKDACQQIVPCEPCPKCPEVPTPTPLPKPPEDVTPTPTDPPNPPDVKPPNDEMEGKKHNPDPLPYGGKDCLVLDAGERSTRGISTFMGPGWLNRAWPQTVGNDYDYVTFTAENGSERVVFSPNITQSGKYEVWVSWWAGENRSTAVPFAVVDGHRKRKQFTFNQNEKDTYGERWKNLGTFYFSQGTGKTKPKKNFIEMWNVGKGTSESIDAVLLKMVK